MDALASLGDIPHRVEATKARYEQRDRRAQQVQAVRRGDFDAVAPDLFSDNWPRPIVANMIDTSARDIASVLAPLPSFNCSASTMLTEKAKKFADKRTKIVNNYVQNSRLQLQMQTGADQFNTYGMLTLCVEPDFDKKLPVIYVEDSFNTYPTWNRQGDVENVFRVMYKTCEELRAEYPEFERKLSENPNAIINGDKIEIIKWVDAKKVVVYAPRLRNMVLAYMPNPLGKCFYVCTRKASLDAEIRGTYDDVIWVQLARHRMQMLAMEAADKSVRAPLVVPPDVGDIPLGPDAVIHTQQGAASVGRARLDVPQAAFMGIEQLKQEMMIGAMSPESRSGNMDASVITGRGVQQLQAGFSSQIASAQDAFIDAFSRAVCLAFELDEKFWPNVEKTVRGQDAGVPYEITYRAERDIAGDYTVDIQYGMYAGLDANRALVLTLQAQAAGLVSREFARRQLPAGINAAEEEKRIEIEAMRDSILQSVSALAQSLPQLVANGQDPSPIVAAVAAVTKALQENKPLEDVVSRIFAPPPPPPPAPPGPQAGAEAPGTGAPGDGSAPGFQDSGLPAGLQPGLATEGPQGRPDLQQFFAGLTSSGNPNLGSVVSRMAPAR
jgi:hypothetical protein